MRAPLLIAILLPLDAGAIGKVERGNTSLEATGNLRLLGGFLHYRDLPPLPDDDALVAGVGRLILKGNFAADVTYDIHGFLDLSRGPIAGLGGTFSTVASFVTPYRTPYLAWDFWGDSSVRGALGLDRASVQARIKRFSITAGRFPINDSVTHLISPNDFFAPFSATAINRIYKPGVDALRVGVSLGQLSGIEVTGVMGNASDGTPSWGRSALFARASTVIKGFDAALVGGKLAERWIVGATFQGSIGPVSLRGEGHAGFADANGNGRLGDGRGEKFHGRFAAGAGYRTTWHNLSIDAEYAFFSDGAGTPADYLMRALRLFPDDLPYLAQHYLGLGVGGEIVPVLRAAATVLINAVDASGLGVLSLYYDISDEAVFAGGLLVPWGDPPQFHPLARTTSLRSEYGAVPITVFLESRLYF